MRAGSALNILIVENDKTIAKTLVDYLRVFGFEGVTAHSSAEAMELLHKNPSIHIVIIDLFLGTESGIALLQEIRAQYAETPHVFMMSGLPVESTEDFFECGAEGFLAKPFQSKTLLDVIRKAMLSPKQRWSVAYGTSPVLTIKEHRSQPLASGGFGFALGRGGFYLETTQAVPDPATPVNIDLILGDLHLLGVATVRWKKKLSNNLQRVGFEFIYLEPNSLDLVLAALDLIPPKIFIPAA